MKSKEVGEKYRRERKDEESDKWFMHQQIVINWCIIDDLSKHFHVQAIYPTIDWLMIDGFDMNTTTLCINHLIDCDAWRLHYQLIKEWINQSINDLMSSWIYHDLLFHCLYVSTSLDRCRSKSPIHSMNQLMNVLPRLWSKNPDISQSLDKS